MTFDPFSAIPAAPSDKSPIPAAGNPPAQDPFAASDEDEDEIHFDLTGEGGVPAVPMAQPSPPPMAEPELRVELTPIAPSSAPQTPAFTAPWEMPVQTAPTAQPANSFSLDLSTPPASPTPSPVSAMAPATTSGGLLGLFDRLVNMIEEETKAFEGAQKKHQANIANEQHLIEEETKAFEKKKTDILKGVEDLKKRLAS